MKFPLVKTIVRVERTRVLENVNHLSKLIFLNTFKYAAELSVVTKVSRTLNVQQFSAK